MRPRASRSLRAAGEAARGGFSLIELLVVVAIIALLLGILLPAARRSREAGRAAVCLSNMRQMAIAAYNYATEHDQSLPTAGVSHGGHIVPDIQGAWITLLQAYADGELLYRCPSDESPHFDVPLDGGRLRSVSLGTNFYVSGDLAGYEQFINLDELVRPSDTNFTAELAETGEYAGADHFHAENWVVDPAAEPHRQLALTRHPGGSNFAMLDGHASTHTLADVYQIGPGSSPGNIQWLTNKFDPTVAR